MNWLSILAGVVLVFWALRDIYLTIFYPSSSPSILSLSVGRGMWQLFRLAVSLRGIDRDRLISHGGPMLLVIIFVIWIMLPISGFALICWPGLGSSIQANDQKTSTTFITALYYSAYTFTTLGIGPLIPKTDIYRLLTILETSLGFASFSLTITYFLSVFNALTKRNTFALKLQYLTGAKANAAEMIALLGANGDFNGVRQEISTIATNSLNLLESHHTYPILHYFRFQKPYYSLARIALLTMDTATLLKSAINQEKYRSLVHSAAVTELESGSLYMLQQLSDSFLPQKFLAGEAQPEREWRQWYYYSVKRLQAEGIHTTPNLEAGADCYVSLRRRWNPYVVGFADYMMYKWSEIAPAPENFDFCKFSR
ncbi:potassium channel family protein [Halotia wernerae UHCC 0503]|nr:potassium channel family protein [Halotia wernerae UHCC 0503]